MTITLDIASFRSAFPAFSSDATYPDATITLYWNMGTCYISDNDYGRLNGNCRELALQMMAAHLISLNNIISDGSTPGQLTASTIDKVSVTLQPPPNKNQWSWWLNNTPYGAQLEALLATASVGGFYVGGRPERRGFRDISGF